MSVQPLDAEVLEFIRRYIDSVEMLEILLLLQREPARAWSVREVTATLRSYPDAIALRLEKLARDGLVEGLSVNDGDKTYRFAGADPARAELVERLGRAYGTYRLRVIEAIYDPSRRALQSFANAFRLGKKEDDIHG